MYSTAGTDCYRDPQKRFAIRVPHSRVSLDGDIERLLSTDVYSAANLFVEGQIQVEGDLIEAIRFFVNAKHSALRSIWFSAAACWHRAMSALSWREAPARNIQFHYDRSNDFYAQFLDSHMQYSAADYRDPGQSLESAQENKLEQICQTLELSPSDRFLDVGCGWGALAVYAAERFGVRATGCTLSEAQFRFAQDLVKKKGLENRVSIDLRDYRDIRSQFDKIASVGMFEHVGRRRLGEYWARMHGMLENNGLFLNRGIVRPEGVVDTPETLFLQESVFPGGELEHLAVVIRTAERAGFEVRRMKDVRESYGQTCRAWVANLEQHAQHCRELVGESTYRTWLLYLARSAVSFEAGTTDAVQILFRKNACQ